MFRIEWLGLVALVTLTVWSRTPAPRYEPPFGCAVPDVTLPRTADPDTGAALDLARARRLADAAYRGGDSFAAAQTIREADARAHDGAIHQELAPLAELYAQFAAASALATDASAPSAARFTALRRAQTLDLALGGAFAASLNAQVRDVAPAAARAFARAGDREGAELAAHTAALFR